MSHRRNFRNILVVRTDRIGDVVLTTPVFEGLRRCYPSARISAMVTSHTRDIVDGNPFLDEVITFDRMGKDQGLRGFLRLVTLLRSKHFDLAINYHLKTSINLMLFCSGIPVRIGFANAKLGFCLTDQYPDPRTDGTKHERDYCLDLLRAFGLDCPPASIRVSVKEESEIWVKHLLQELGIGLKDLMIAIHPGASCLSKRWPPVRFAQTADLLIQKYQAKIALIGSGDNQPIAKEVLLAMKQPVFDLTGRTTVSHLISLLKRCALLVSNDSGPVHLAVGVKTPVISIFGRNQAGLSPCRWRPLGPQDIVLHSDLGCKVCLAHQCQREFQCLRAISVDHVVQAAEHILNQSCSTTTSSQGVIY